MVERPPAARLARKHHRRARAHRTTQQDLATFLRRRALLRRVALALLLLLVVALSIADYTGHLLYHGGDWRRYHGRAFRVIRVLDGDTIDVAAPDGERMFTRVRLWGITCPSVAKPALGVPGQQMGEEAMRFTVAAAGERVVTLRLQAHRPRDQFGRLLAYVDPPGADGASLNERLLEEGLAKADGRWSHDRVDRFADLERDARKAKRGLWALPAKDRRTSAPREAD